MNKKTFSLLGFILLLSVFVLNFISAVDFNQDISSQDKETFDQILEPVTKIYNLVKYSASVLAVIVLLSGGITYMTAGSDPAKREQAKNVITYVIIGLIVIWVAPLMVNFIVS